MRILSLLALALSFGCVQSHGTGADPADRVWVSRAYTGGVQCRADIGYGPPDTRAVLREVGVTVHATAQEGLLACEACDCPGYSMMHHALIDASDVRRASRAGYQPRTPPSYVLPDSLRPRTPEES